MTGALTRYMPDTRQFGLGAEMDWAAMIGAGMQAAGEISSAVGSGIASAQARRAEEARAAALSAAVPWIVGGVVFLGGAIVLAVVLK